MLAAGFELYGRRVVLSCSIPSTPALSGLVLLYVVLSIARDRPPDCCGCAPVADGYLELEMPEISPVPVPVSVGPSTLHTLSSGVRDGSASVTSTSLTAGRLLRCLALSACGI
uniref:Uncharacterized protein n=1 Tax=Anopheles minimus TaxID=112268 RepID=A0A182W8Y2_9DIPT